MTKDGGDRRQLNNCAGVSVPPCLSFYTRHSWISFGEPVDRPAPVRHAHRFLDSHFVPPSATLLLAASE